MGRAASVLDRRVAFVALAAALGIYYATHESWFSLTLWQDLAWLAFVLIPAVFGLVWFALPLRARPLRDLLIVAVACAVGSVLLTWAGADILANFAKLATMTFVGWSFLWLFEELSWGLPVFDLERLAGRLERVPLIRQGEGERAQVNEVAREGVRRIGFAVLGVFWDQIDLVGLSRARKAD